MPRVFVFIAVASIQAMFCVTVEASIAAITYRVQRSGGGGLGGTVGGTSELPFLLLTEYPKEGVSGYEDGGVFGLATGAVAGHFSSFGSSFFKALAFAGAELSGTTITTVDAIWSDSISVPAEYSGQSLSLNFSAQGRIGYEIPVGATGAPNQRGSAAYTVGAAPAYESLPLGNFYSFVGDAASAHFTEQGGSESSGFNPVYTKSDGGWTDFQSVLQVDSETHRRYDVFTGLFSIEVIPFARGGPQGPIGPPSSLARADWGMRSLLLLNAENSASILADLQHTLSLVSVTDATGNIVPNVSFESGLSLGSAAVPEATSLLIWSVLGWFGSCRYFWLRFRR
jgi:hypothetical protein